MLPNWIFTLVFSLFITAPAVAQIPSAVSKAHATAHRIVIDAYKEPNAFCSATAIGPHALLTATHCMAPMMRLAVDGKDANIVEQFGDSLDHTIFLLSDIEFKDYAEFADNQDLDFGETIYVFGNPGKFSDMLRVGYVSGFDETETFPESFSSLFSTESLPKTAPTKRSDVIYFDINGFFGDSGGGIFNKDGKLVGVISFIEEQSRGSASQKFMGGFRMKISKGLLERARNYKGDK